VIAVMHLLHQLVKVVLEELRLFLTVVEEGTLRRANSGEYCGVRTAVSTQPCQRSYYLCGSLNKNV
jgi:ferredoxin-NADP reductase